MRSRSPRRRLNCQTSFGWLAAFLAMAVAGCSSSKGAPQPSASPTRSVSPSPSSGAKPGGTLRIAGVTKSVALDPASPLSDPTAIAGVGAATSAADANRLFGRLVLRQLYGYPAQAPTAAGTSVTATVPKPDLASAAPKLSDEGRIATITMRSARWDVPSARRVTATDQLRALKRLCLPSVNSPVSGYLAESVVGYAAACQSLASDPPATLAALDAVTVSGLATEGDNTLVIHLIRATSDLTAILALPQTSPLPVESFTGILVTNNAQSFVGDGPYRFVEPNTGETYALSRSPSWDPASDPLRHAYVDHISVRGGLTTAKVQQLVKAGSDDLSLDVPLTAAAAAAANPAAVVRTTGQSSVVLALGSKGANARRLASPAVRQVLAACIDTTTTRARVTAALGPGVSAMSDALFSGLSLVPAGEPSPAASSSPTLTPAPGASASGASLGAAATSPVSASPPESASGSVTPSPSPVARCVPTAGVTGAKFSLLIADSAPLRAAATVIAASLKAAGAHVTVKVTDVGHYDAYARIGGWDLTLSVRPIRYPAPRSLLAPLLDAGWRGSDAVLLLRSPTFVVQMLTATAARTSNSSIQLWGQLRASLTQTATLLPLASVDAVYPLGPNVANAPTVPTFSNADPTNVALGSTRPTEAARTATPTP